MKNKKIWKVTVSDGGVGSRTAVRTTIADKLTKEEAETKRMAEFIGGTWGWATYDVQPMGVVYS